MDEFPRLERKVQFLVSSGVATIDHSHNNLLCHLLGTCKLLTSWGARPAVCDAGLFHSIYGTESFGLSAIPIEYRQSVQAVIGIEAETLVYLFGTKQGETFFDQAISEADLYKSPYGANDQSVIHGQVFLVKHRLTGEDMSISREQLLDLVNISIANALEQAPRLPYEYQEETRAFFRRLRPLALLPAQRAIDCVFGI